MNNNSFHDVMRREDFLPIFMVVIGIIGIFVEIIDPLLADDHIFAPYDWLILGAYGMIATFLLISFMILIKNFVKNTLVKHESRKDERELMHDYIVSQLSYTIMMIGASIYAFFISPNSVTDLYFFILFVIIISVRIFKRYKLAKEN